MDDESLQEALEEENSYKFTFKDFHDRHPDYCIDKLELDESDKISVVEYAPKIFRNIRKSMFTEETLLESLIPAVNYVGIHNFEPG